MPAEVEVHVVVPTVGRESLHDLLVSLADADGPLPVAVTLVDDRRHARAPLLARDPPAAVADRLQVVRTGGRGPAAARNAGWRTASAPWVAFLDDDVLVPKPWLRRLHDDLADLPMDVGASQGRIHVPLPRDRPPTDWERNVAGLEHARWATADMTYRRAALASVGGFDERFPRAYREDTDLGLRVSARGWRIVHGERTVLHPARPTDDQVSVRLQAGNAEDPFMRVLHGPRWRDLAGAPGGRRPWHLAAVAAATVGIGALLVGRAPAALVGGATWATLTADLTRRRIAPGPRTLDEVRRMTLTSVQLPFAATWHWVRGIVGLRRRLALPGPRSQLPAAVLFDRDGTLVEDVPYNGDPARVRPVPGAAETVALLRRLDVRVGVVSNQSGIGRGLLDRHQIAAVEARIEALLGPFDVWEFCPHAPEDGCVCRKPLPGLVERAAARLGVDVADCVVVGDIGADVAAATAAGARPILVPTSETRPEEVAAAPEVVGDLPAAVLSALAGSPVAPGPVGAGR